MSVSALQSVAEIAFLASDVLVDSLPRLPDVSRFQLVYTAQSRANGGSRQIVSLPAGADVGPTLLRNGSAGLISYTTTSNKQVFNQLLVHLPELSDLPLVLHVALDAKNEDLGDVLVLRSSVPFFIYSKNAQEARDHALLASRLAKAEKKAVVHVFHAELEVTEAVEDDALRRFLLETPSGAVNGHSDVSARLATAYHTAASETAALTGKPLDALTIHGMESPHTLIFTLGQAAFDFALDGVTFVDVSLLSPFPLSQVTDLVTESVTRIIILEQIHNWSVKWTPLYLEVIGALQHLTDSRPAVHSGVLGKVISVSVEDVEQLIEVATSSAPNTKLQLGDSFLSPPSFTSTTPHVPKHEASYTKILNQIFGERLEIVNSPDMVASQGQIATSPEYALGRIGLAVELRAEVVRIAQDLVQDREVPEDLHSLLSRWIVAKDDPQKAQQAGKALFDGLQSSEFSNPTTKLLLQSSSHFNLPSRWIIGSDAWSYDLGSSGLHHAIASGLNLNILILDTTPYSSRNKVDPNRRKHDVGLYAMNHGDVYVASTAVYSSYSQVLQSIIEAEKFNGPSVVLAYLPYESEETSALEILKETKLAVDAGYWPLYRWNPAKEREGKEPFVLDSEAVKNDLQQFLDRQNHLSQLTRSKPELASELVSSLGETVKEARKKRAKQAYEELLSAIDAPPLLIVYASDGGQAEKVAKRLANRGKMRGLSTTVSTLDAVSLEDLAKEEYVAFVTSVAGQGEFPQNGRSGWKALSAALARGDKILSSVKFSVFGMGDSHYWPRPEDAHYYNKSGKDLNARLEQLGAERVVDLGLGDDQDADGHETGYKIWEPKLWKALGVDSIEVNEAEPEPITNEHIKAASSYLRGTIAEGLVDTTTGALAPSDTQLTKFHGIYQQDDRDIRDERQAQGVEPAYSFMIRLRMPGGVCDPHQWQLIDRIADEHGSGTFKITTRQTFQFHGVIKRHLKPAIQDINRALLDTLAACGDVNR